jgi:ketosteroid isomerase-like protein
MPDRAVNVGDIETIVTLYEPRALLVAQPGQLAEGFAALREALRGLLAMKPTLTLEQHMVVTCGDIALSVDKWTLTGTGPDGTPVHMEGTASAVLRQQSNGRWLYVIDNPWGAGILG